MKTPRPYQAEALERYLNRGMSDKHPLIVAATGTGKTYIASLIIDKELSMGGRVLWVTHRHKLAEQAGAAIAEQVGQGRVGYVGADLGEDYDADVVVAKKDSLRYGDRMARLGAFALVVVDEVHHAPNDSYQTVFEKVPHGRRLGLTATPDRTDNLSLSDQWEILYSYGMMDGIRDGYLLRPYAAVDKPPMLDLSKVPHGRKDFVAPDLERELLRAHIVEHTADALDRTHTAHSLPLYEDARVFDPRAGGGVLVYCVGIEQAEATAVELQTRGWSVEVLHSEVPREDQDRIVSAFETRKLKCIVNVGILTEGTDLPWAQTVVLARPTTSWSLFMQVVGRAVRLHEGQDACFVIDLVGITQHHSIVSAPVLVDGVDCSESTDGKHRYLPLATGEGRCQYCQHVIKCYVNNGGHKFSKRGLCECGATQCEHSPDQTHHFVPWEPGVRMCIHCGLNHADPLGSLVGRTNPPKVPVLWEKLRLTGTIHACHLGEVGILFKEQVGGLWRPWWHPTRGQQLTPLSKGPVEERLADLLTQDVARRAVKVRGYYGGRSRRTDLNIAMKEAQRIARVHGLGR